MNTLKQNLSFAHKIVAKLKMDDLTYTHISARVEKEDEFLISPFGIQFAFVEPESLLNFNFEGQLLGESKGKNFNKTGFAIHSSIYKARPEVACVIHLHTKETIAVSVNKKGLLPLSQHALHFYNQVAYHCYDSLVLTPKAEEELLIKDLGKNNVMFLRNHGFIAIGKTIWEALFYAYHLQKACEAQVLVPSEDVIFPSHEVCEKARKDLLSFEKDLGRRDFESFLQIL